MKNNKVVLFLILFFSVNFYASDQIDTSSNQWQKAYEAYNVYHNYRSMSKCSCLTAAVCIALPYVSSSENCCVKLCLPVGCCLLGYAFSWQEQLNEKQVELDRSIDDMCKGKKITRAQVMNKLSDFFIIQNKQAAKNFFGTNTMKRD